MNLFYSIRILSRPSFCQMRKLVFWAKTWQHIHIVAIKVPPMKCFMHFCKVFLVNMVSWVSVWFFCAKSSSIFWPSLKVCQFLERVTYMYFQQQSQIQLIIVELQKHFTGIYKHLTSGISWLVDIMNVGIKCHVQRCGQRPR